MLDRTFDEFVERPSESQKRSRQPWPRNWWLNVLLLGLTFLSTTVFGFALQRSFQAGRELSEADWLLGFRVAIAGSRAVWGGISYSIPLILILLAHELGHYAMCRRWHVKATLPFFGPSPTLLGTVGAFIWIRSPIYRRRALFDIGVSGPLLGFVVLLPFLVIGVWNSKLCPGLQVNSEFAFGTPLLFRVLEAMRFPGATPANICLHPMAMAAWAGLLATSINLLPVGQLDGGHIIYAVLGERGHRRVSWLVTAILAIAGVLYWPWWIWAVVMFFFRRHPLVHDEEPIGAGRRTLSLAALMLLLLSFSIVPVRAG